MSLESTTQAMITIITPTYGRHADVLKRCMDCVDGQTYTHWRHIVIVDDEYVQPHVTQDTVSHYTQNGKREFVSLGKHTNNYGNTPRRHGIYSSQTKYIMFMDDDNVIFPNYLQVMIEHLELHEDAQPSDFLMAVCKIIHMGPLPEKLCPPPKILDGRPPVLQNIDTLQVVVTSDLAKKCGWLDQGYLADGYTIELYSHHANHIVYVDEILAVHM